MKWKSSEWKSSEWIEEMSSKISPNDDAHKEIKQQQQPIVPKQDQNNDQSKPTNVDNLEHSNEHSNEQSNEHSNEYSMELMIFMLIDIGGLLAVFVGVVVYATVMYTQAGLYALDAPNTPILCLQNSAK